MPAVNIYCISRNTHNQIYGILDFYEVTMVSNCPAWGGGSGPALFGTELFMDRRRKKLYKILMAYKI